MGLRVFLSYGHDEYASAADRISAFLKDRGHEVWFDRERLKPGRDWEASIEQGLDWVAAVPDKGRVVLVMTPYSVRRPDGFCLNEISRALERRLTIVPVMLVWVQPPLAINRIQWLDLTACVPLPERAAQFDKGMAALGEALEGGRVDLEGGQARLFGLLNPLAFDEEIGRHVARFSGREWASRAVKNWLADPAPPSRIFWIAGPPGIGKTAIAVQIATTCPEIVAWHFCHFGHFRKSDPASCVTSIAYQLAAQLPDYFQRLLRVRIGELLERTSDARTLFDELIVQPLFNLPDPGRVMAVLIDALDEATRDGKNDLASFIANDFERVPAWLRVIVTSRLTPELVTAFAGRQPFDLSAHPEEARRDLAGFLSRELSQASAAPHVQISNELIDRLVAQADGNFLYAEAMRRELAAGTLTLDRLPAFPRGLVGIYSDFFRRQFPDLPEYKRRVRPFLEIVAAAQGELSLDLVAGLLGWDPYDRKETIDALGSIYPLDGDFIRPFHKSLTDWVTDEKAAGPYWVSTQMGHSRLADLDSTLAERASSRRPPADTDAIIAAGLPAAEQPAQSRQVPAAYDEEHRLTHLIEAGRFEDFRSRVQELADDALRGNADQRRDKRARIEVMLKLAAREWPVKESITPLQEALVSFARAGSRIGNPGEMQYIISRALNAVVDGMSARPELAACIPAILDEGLLGFLRHPAAEIDMAAYSTLDASIREARTVIGSNPAFTAWARTWDAYLA